MISGTRWLVAGAAVLLLLAGMADTACADASTTAPPSDAVEIQHLNGTHPWYGARCVAPRPSGAGECQGCKRCPVSGGHVAWVRTADILERTHTVRQFRDEAKTFVDDSHRLEKHILTELRSPLPLSLLSCEHTR